MEYHVSKSGSDKNNGSIGLPFLTISKAAAVAEEGDYIIVHEGTYREWVNPKNGSRSAYNPIVYMAAEGEHVVIKGSEQITEWNDCGNGVWSTVVPNSLFGTYNPYVEVIDGDWLITPLEPMLHTGQVYINGEALSEAADKVQVETGKMTWCCQVNETDTIIHANFVKHNPNEELTEINVRKCCFYPDRMGINYITIRGFEMAHAACTWAPPTTEQFGMIGAHWSKGWVIEDNILHDARCSAISIGKELTSGDNLYTRYHRKPGYQTQLEAVFAAKRLGWSKENVGNHIIRNNTIYDCGQNGIVGQMGGAFSEIYGNHIYNIGNKHEFHGFEIAGIKLHAAIDTYIHHNHIHDCKLGTWLDWQAQGVRLSSNLYHHNEVDAWIEVTHGPHLVDNNIFGSGRTIKNAAQGGAYVHNLFVGGFHRYDERKRSTPYHLPHSTEIMGTAVVYGHDDRFFNNIFVDDGEEREERWICGTSMYDGCPITPEEYIERATIDGRGDVNKYINVLQPAYIKNNYYADGIKAFDREDGHICTDTHSDIKISMEDKKVYLEINLDEKFNNLSTEIITTDKLPLPRFPEAPFENPDGSKVAVNTDFFGKDRGSAPTAGPFENISAGRTKILLWEG